MSMNREAVIVRTGIVGIVVNVLLAAFKAAVGLTANSIAVILDAVNNLTDAISSIVTIGGTKLSARKPDKAHPLGFGRVEYLTALIVAGLVLYAGITSAVESVKKIINPATPDYSAVSLLIIAVAIAVKIFLGRYVKAKGESVNSGALKASGAGAMFDAVLSASVLASALFFIATGISLEAYVGAVISLVIIKAGIGMIVDTLNDILGKRENSEVTDQITKILCEEPKVHGAYDLVVYNFGPSKNLASVHLELPDTMTVKEVDALTRRVESRVMKETGVLLAGVGVYSYNTHDDKAKRIRDDIRKRLAAHPWVVQSHGFYLDEAKKAIRFDVVMSFDIKPEDGLREIYDEMRSAYPEYSFQITPDVDVSVSK